ncbi:MAG TPA: DUF1707 domain-containing protein [Acidimicrobiales bacterium]|nr:DUF1707 domain-containing protein [Acidimicrobiales bacterium]
MSASESERDRTVKALTKHCGDGRITLEELEERIELAYAAGTSADLKALLADLPKDDLLAVTGITPSPALQRHPSPSPPSAPKAPARPSRRAGEVALAIHAVVYLSIMALLVVIWLLTSPFGYPWPIWPALGMGLPLAIHAGIMKAVSR